MTYVLFVCNHNAGRSQMAQAFFERDAPPGAEAESAGTNPGEQVWPEADLAVTMGCGDACPYVPTTVEDWDLPDPAGRPIGEVREVRDTIEQRVKQLIAERIVPS